MKNFKSGNDKRGGFGGSRGGREDRGGRGEDKPVFYGKSRGGDRSTDREQRMFKAICSDCKKSCDVPFKPSSDKPVFCRDCFSAKRDRETKEYKAGLAGGESKKFGQDKPLSHVAPMSLPKVDESMKKQLAEMGARLDKLTSLVEAMIEVKGKDTSSTVHITKPVVVVAKKVASPVKKVEAKKAVAKKVAPKNPEVKKVTKKVVKKVTVKKTK